MPKCPYCSREIMKLYVSARLDLEYSEGKWLVDFSPDGTSVVCSECYGEFGPRDLEILKIPRITN